MDNRVKMANSSYIDVTTMWMIRIWQYDDYVYLLDAKENMYMLPGDRSRDSLILERRLPSGTYYVVHDGDRIICLSEACQFIESVSVRD